MFHYNKYGNNEPWQHLQLMKWGYKVTRSSLNNKLKINEFPQITKLCWGNADFNFTGGNSKHIHLQQWHSSSNNL